MSTDRPRFEGVRPWPSHRHHLPPTGTALWRLCRKTSWTRSPPWWPGTPPGCGRPQSPPQSPRGWPVGPCWPGGGSEPCGHGHVVVPAIPWPV